MNIYVYIETEDMPEWGKFFTLTDAIHMLQLFAAPNQTYFINNSETGSNYRYYNGTHRIVTYPLVYLV